MSPYLRAAVPFDEDHSDSARFSGEGVLEWDMGGWCVGVAGIGVRERASGRGWSPSEVPELGDVVVDDDDGGSFSSWAVGKVFPEGRRRGWEVGSLEEASVIECVLI